MTKCEASRWKDIPDKTTLTKKQRRKAVPNKVLRYFPIKPRLKRIFMNKETAQLTRCNDEERTKDGALRHLLIQMFGKLLILNTLTLH